MKKVFLILAVSSLLVWSATAIAAVTDPWVSVISYGATGNGSTDDGTAIANAISACPTGGTVYFPPTSNYYRVTAEITVNKSITIRGGQYPQVKQVTGNRKLFKITANDVTITGLDLRGPQYATNYDSERAISCEGASAASPISGIRIMDNKISSMGGYGIYMLFTNDFLISGNKIKDVDYAGIMGYSVKRGQITDNNITNITNASNAFGICINRYKNLIGDDPRSEHIVVKGNIIKDVPSWEGLDAHGGQGISFIGNTVINTDVAINVIESDDSGVGGSNHYPPLDIIVEGNMLDSTRTNGSFSYGYGIFFSGSSSSAPATGVIKGNLIRGHGKQNDTNSAGIRATCTNGLEYYN